MTPQQQYTNIQRRVLDVEDYIDILRRHMSWILAPVFAGLVISCVVAFFMKNTYISKAVLRITPPQISETLVPTTANQLMSDRVAQMETQILSRTSLSELIQRPTLNLYQRERKDKPMEDVIEQMRNHDVHIIVMNMAGAGGRPTVAFEIQFQYDDASKAKAVVEALITRFMEESVTVQQTGSRATTDFFKEEIQQARADLTRLENEITVFQQRNSGHLPEDLNYNVQRLNVAQNSLAAVREAQVRLDEEKSFIESNLQTLKARRDELQAMAQTTVEQGGMLRPNEHLAQVKAELAGMENQLTIMLQSFTESYPEIKQARAQIELKKKERDKLQEEEDAAAARVKPATAKVINNPQVRGPMIDLQGSIDSLNISLRNKENDRLMRIKQEQELEKKIQELEGLIAASPPNQQKYVSMLRERNLADQHYQELERRETMASTYDHVGKQKAGENLEVLDNATLPSTPAAPNRWMICGMGIGVGFMIGVVFDRN